MVCLSGLLAVMATLYCFGFVGLGVLGVFGVLEVAWWLCLLLLFGIDLLVCGWFVGSDVDWFGLGCCFV